MTRPQIISYFFIGLFIFILYQIFLIFSPFMHAIFWAGTLAFAFYPWHQAILNRLEGKRSLASLISTTIVILIVAPPAITLFVNVTQEAIELYERIRIAVSDGSYETWLAQIKAGLASEWAQKIWVRLEPFQHDVVDGLVGITRRIGNLTAVRILAITKSVLFIALNFFLVILLLFVFFRDGKVIYQFIYELIPMETKHKQVLAFKMNETFSAVIRGQLLTAIIQGILAGITFWVLDLPTPLLVGFATFLASMIPVTGASTVWGPFACYLFLTNENTKGMILLIVGIFVISLSDNFLKPVLIGEKTKLPIFLLFLGMLGGLQLYGLTGIFLGPIVLSLFFVLVKIYEQEYPIHNHKD